MTYCNTHDTPLDQSDECPKCIAAKMRQLKLRDRFCHNGHDKLIAGNVSPHGQCTVCRNALSRARYWRTNGRTKRLAPSQTSARMENQVKGSEVYLELVLAIENAMPWERAAAQAKADAWLQKMRRDDVLRN